MTNTLWLIRHGESEANAGLAATVDYADIRLTERGRQQAQQAATQLERPDLIVCSSYRRAIETAEPTRARYLEVPVETWPIFEFTFLCDDQCYGTTIPGRQHLVRDFWGRADPNYVAGRNAESFAGFVQRVRDSLDHAATVPGWTIAFTHEMFIQAVILHVLGGLSPTPEDMLRYQAIHEAVRVPNLGMIAIGFRSDGTRWLSGPQSLS